MKTSPDQKPSLPTGGTDVAASRRALLWGAGPALACGFWIYALGPRLFDLSLGWAGIRTLLLVACCSVLQFGCAALPQPVIRKVLGSIGWLAAAAALVFLIIARY
jgi:hypothetical protein